MKIQNQNNEKKKKSGIKWLRVLRRGRLWIGRQN